MKKILSLFICLLLLVLVGCDQQVIHGEIRVLSPMTLHSSSGMQAISPGQYQARLRIHTNKQLAFRRQLELKLKQDGQEKNLTLRIPPGFDIPPSGEFHLPASENGQIYDIIGENISKMAYSGPVIREYESCHFYIGSGLENHCLQGRWGNLDDHSCHYDSTPVFVLGDRMVEYQHEIVTTKIHLQLQSPEKGQILATFISQGQWIKEQHYNEVGPCHGNYYDKWHDLYGPSPLP